MNEQKNTAPISTAAGAALMLRTILEDNPGRRVNIIITNGAHLDRVRIVKIGEEALQIEAAGQTEMVMLNAISTIIVAEG